MKPAGVHTHTPTPSPTRSGPAVRLLVIVLLAMVAASGCTAPAFHERAKLVRRAMTLDADESLTYIRNKAEAAREGAFGGFGGASAGGCGCQ
ncbi:MAG: DUF4266 domain-containing protein [Planctomycetota bacterium]